MEHAEPMANKNRNIRVGLAIAWLLLTTALILWWMRFALTLIEHYASESSRFRLMLLEEGATLLILLLVGGLTLIYFILQESRQAHRLREFLAHFSHDIKTALSGVRLQTESLRADNRDTSLNDLIDRLSTDTSRLQNQVENSLFVGGAQSSTLYTEVINFQSLIELLRDSWPKLNIKLSQNALLHADRRALESVLNNLIHNSIVHGKAQSIEFSIAAAGAKHISMTVTDDGRGFSGDLKTLGHVFQRASNSSGSGLGLYTVRIYIDRMGGCMHFEKSEPGFKIVIELPGELAKPHQAEVGS
jgi:signal transduction histidine kinase